MEKKRIMIIGGGNLCLQVLKILAPQNNFDFFVASRNYENTYRLCNLARVAAIQLGAYPNIQPLKLDLASINMTSETIAMVNPDVIFNCASLQSWRRITELPKHLFDDLDEAQLGPWLPMHLSPMYKLMTAVRLSGTSALTINAAFPDAVNHVLGKVGLAPDIGVGNIANLIPATRCAIALLAEVPVKDVSVRLIGQHYFSHYVPRGGMPPIANYHLSYRVDGNDMTGEFDDNAIFDRVRKEFRRLGGVDGQFLTAASAVTVLSNIFSPEPVEVHAPAPYGLPGGYPVRLQNGSIDLNLPEGISQKEAIDINDRCQTQDGIDSVSDDGTIYFGEQQMAVMKSVLGYSITAMRINEVDEYAQALGSAYQSFVNNVHNVGGTA